MTGSSAAKLPSMGLYGRAPIWTKPVAGSVRRCWAPSQPISRINRAVDIALSLAGNKLVLEPADQELTRLPAKGCVPNSVETMSGWPLLGWVGSPAPRRNRSRPVSSLGARTVS